MNKPRTTFAVVGELADVLQQFRDLHCAPTLDTDDDKGVVLTIAVAATAQDDIRNGMRVFELCSALDHVMGMMQLRALAQHYGIDAARLEAPLPEHHDG